jgi:hypothetical protein
VIALRSLRGFAKPDCGFALQRKLQQSSSAAKSVTLSPVRIAGKVLEIAAISSDSPGITAGFLCNKDWVAERVGFVYYEI